MDECDFCKGICKCMLRQKNDIIKCLNCGQVLISGKGAVAIFGKGSSIECLKCGNKYEFGEK